MSPTTVTLIFMVVVFVSALIAWFWLRIRHTKESKNMGDDSLRERDQDSRDDPDNPENHDDRGAPDHRGNPPH